MAPRFGLFNKLSRCIDYSYTFLTEPTQDECTGGTPFQGVTALDKYQQLKNEYTALENFITSLTPSFQAEEFGAFILAACALKIWGSFPYYSPDYSQALFAIIGNAYTPEQVITVMLCCAEEELILVIPSFFQDLLFADMRQTTTYIGGFLPILNSILVSLASINGDFAVEEANTQLLWI